MPVPSAISDLSQTAGSNNPPGSESPTTADDYFRAYASFIAMLRDGIGFTDPVQLASATTTSIGAQNAMFVEITGTTTITGFGTTYNGPRFLRFTGALTLTHNSTTLNLPGAANITTAAGDTAIAVPNQALSGWNVVQYQKADGSPISIGTVAVSSGGTGQTTQVNARSNVGFMRGGIGGLTLSTAGSSATFSVSAGEAVDSGNAWNMVLSSAISKTTSAWAVGTGNGGLDTGAIANSTWYHAYLIRRPDTGVVDVVFSTNASSPTLPTNYTQYRRIGSLRTNGSAQWVSFTQDGDYFRWSASVLDVNTTNPGTSAVSATLTVPTGVNVFALFNGNVNSTDANPVLHFSDLAATDEAPSSSAAPLGSALTSGGPTVALTGPLEIRTNTSAQIRYRISASTANTSVRIATLGWFDSRGRNA